MVTNKLTATELVAIIEENYGRSEFAGGEWSSTEKPLGIDAEGMSWKDIQQAHLYALGLGVVEEIEEQGGGEGEGEYYHKVWYFKDHDVYLMICGEYYSHDGLYFEQGPPFQVFPKQKTITVYES